MLGGAIKGQHFDIYQGIGHEAGQAAGFYNHYGRVWVLKMHKAVVRCSLLIKVARRASLPVMIRHYW